MSKKFSLSIETQNSLKKVLEKDLPKKEAYYFNELNKSNLLDFLEIEDLDLSIIKDIIEQVLSIHDDKKIVLTTVLLNRWFYNMEAKTYIKHIASNTKNILYQINLSGSIWDGVYEFNLKGIKANAIERITDDNIHCLEIISPGNFDVLLEKTKENKLYGITRMEMGTPGFDEYILKNKFVTPEELKKFTQNNSFTKGDFPLIKIS